MSSLTNVIRLVLFVLQGGYIAHLFSGTVERVNQASSVGSHFSKQPSLEYIPYLPYYQHC